MFDFMRPALPAVLFFAALLLLVMALRRTGLRWGWVAALALFGAVGWLAVFVSHAVAQQPGDVLDAVCSPGARPYLITLLSVIGVGNLVAWCKMRLGMAPKWVQAVVHFCALNWPTVIKLLRNGAPVMLLAMFLAGCANTPKPVTEVVAALQTPTAQSLINGVGNFAPGASQVIAKVNQGLAVAQSDKAMVCGGMSYADAAFKLLAPQLGSSASDVANEAASMTAVEDLCDSDNSNLGAAVATVAKAYSDTTAQLQAAGAPVPVAPPVSRAAAIVAPASGS
jgi:hypothetical protein